MPRPGERFRDLVEQSGARHVGGASVLGIERRDDRLAVSVSDGVTIECGLVLAATGVDPQSGIAAAAGLKVDGGRIVVDADGRTSAPDVYAAGDVALTYNDAAGRHIAVEHWQDAVDQGEIAGANAAGARGAGLTCPASGRPSVTRPSSTTPGVMATTRRASSQRRDGFTVWYSRDGAAVGVLTCNADDDYDAGETLIREGKPPPLPMR